MPSADQVPTKLSHSTMLWHEWVVLIAGSTGSALRAVRPPNLHITPVVRRDFVYRASATGSLYRSPLAIMAQTIRAILLASAIAATFVGRLASKAVSQGRCLVPWILAGKWELDRLPALYVSVTIRKRVPAQKTPWECELQLHHISQIGLGFGLRWIHDELRRKPARETQYRCYSVERTVCANSRATRYGRTLGASPRDRGSRTLRRFSQIGGGIDRPSSDNSISGSCPSRN